jgi:hypothetical protein
MTGMSFRNNVFSMGANGFSTANRYPRQVALPADAVLTMVQGPSFAFNASLSGSVGVSISWRFECGALTFSSENFAPVPPAGFAVDKPIGL